MNDKPHHLVGKPSNNSKADGNKAESFVHMRCFKSDKGAWVHAAREKGMKLTEWIIQTLNAAIKK